MNVNRVEKQISKYNEEIFSRLINFSKVQFIPSSKNGINVELVDGVHKIYVGMRVTDNQIQRATLLILIDITNNTQNENERVGYSEYGGSVQKLQNKFFPTKFVFVENENGIERDEIVDCDSTFCRLRNNGDTSKRNIIGLNYVEAKVSPSYRHQPKNNDVVENFTNEEISIV